MQEHHIVRAGIGRERDDRQRLAVEFVQLRLWVEEIDVRETAALKQTQHPFRLGREMRQAGQAFALGADGVGEARRKQRAERDPADAAGGLTDEGATREMPEIVGERRGRLHGRS